MTLARTIRMEVTATVEFPEGYDDTTDDRAIQLAMSSVTSSHEVACGRTPQGSIAWAKIYAEVADHDCEVTDP